VEVGFDCGHEARVDGVEGWVGQRDVTGRSAGAHAIQLTEDTDTTADIRRVLDATTDAHAPVLSTANDDDFIVRA